MSAESYLKGLFGMQGRTAVVIGGTGVLGAAICEALAGAGALTRSSSAATKTGETTACNAWRLPVGGAEFFAADSTNRKDLESLVAHLTRRTGRPTCSSTGPGSIRRPPSLKSPTKNGRILNVNLRSVRLACQVFGKYMIQRGTRGSIINIASLSGITPLSRVFTYAATKAAVINLSQNLAREWASLGIRVNALSPGFFPAEQNKAILTDERIEDIMRHTPVKRFGLPKELAGAILFLASPNAGSFVTDSNLIVDGGFSSMTI